MANFEEVGKQFVQHYFNVFDDQRDQLSTLYSDQSMLSYEGEQFLGTPQIMGKLSGMPSIKHKLITFDAQPTFNNGILCFVSGDLIIDGNTEQPMKFAQTFHLCQGGPAGYYCHNDLFRLNYG